MKTLKDYLTEQTLEGSAMFLPRASMPQINNIESFKKFLTNKGVTYKDYYAASNSLTPLQSDFDQTKIDRMIAANTSNMYSPIIVARTSTGHRYILDGHHRYIALKQMNMTVPVIEVEIEAIDLLRTMYAFDNMLKTSTD